MKNLLILIVSIAVFLHFYPQPEVTAWYNEQKDQALDKFSDATDTKVRLKADKIYLELKPKLNQFRPSEQKHLKEITSSRPDIKKFYRNHCGKQQDPKFNRQNQALVCATIAKYQNLL